MINDRVMQLIRIASEKNFLDLSYNRLIQLPPEITKLKNLTKLNLSQNLLTQLPPEIGEFENLIELDLSYNRLIQLPPEIGKLKNLEIINLTRNQLSQLPPEIGELKNLKSFYLTSNQLPQLPFEIRNLKNLRALYLSSNQLTQLLPEIVELKNLRALNLSENPLTSPPPEIVSMGLEAIFTYLKQSRTSEHNEAKLILVGYGEVGKTCLANRLIYGKFVEEGITEGINISEWITSAPDSEDSKIKLNIWDFGGQEIYHSTHQFFLTTRSVYLLVWNARKAKDYDSIYYWLHTIEAFGGESPIIVVMSKKNESDDDLNLRDLRSKFPQIKDYQKIDSKDGTGISILKEIIRKTAWSLPLMKVRWVDSWYRVREKLEGFRENWIPYEEFYNICISEGLDDTNISILDGYLHELGVTLHFKDRLENMVILKPEWATGAFYNILSAKSVLHREGILLYSELNQIWNKEMYPSNIYPQLMDLMNKFELAYELPDKSSYLIPELLPKSAPDFMWDEKDNLCFYYCYDYFLPPGIITRFIVRMHQDIEKKENGLPLCWREGAVLKLKNSIALVKMKPDDKQIEIRVKGDNKRRMLEIICYHLDHINSSIKKISVSKQIPCKCSENCPQLYGYENLLDVERDNDSKLIQCHISFKDMPISLLLEGYKKNEERDKEYDEIHSRTIINYGGITMSNDNIHIHDVIGPVNVKARLDHVEQMVMNAPAVANTKKKELSALIEELKHALEPAASAKSDDTDRVIEDAERVAKEVSRENPNKSRLMSITEDLKETANAVKDIAPTVIPVATKIADFVAGMF
jgi:small GTP-binding protein